MVELRVMGAVVRDGRPGGQQLIPKEFRCFKPGHPDDPQRGLGEGRLQITALLRHARQAMQTVPYCPPLEKEMTLRCTRSQAARENYGGADVRPRTQRYEIIMEWLLWINVA